jgi:outer membrane protease
MIYLQDAIRALNPSVVTIRGEIAYDINNQEVAYNKSDAEAKLTQLQAEETAKQQAEISAKASAQAKLAALGLTADEVKAILGVA